MKTFITHPFGFNSLKYVINEQCHLISYYDSLDDNSFDILKIKAINEAYSSFLILHYLYTKNTFVFGKLL